METVTPARSVCLRPDAINRILAPLGLPRLNRAQQAAILGIANTTYWRLVNGHRCASGQTIAELLDAANRLAARWNAGPVGFDDLFEIRTVRDVTP